jgi:hypothetical protein
MMRAASADAVHPGASVSSVKTSLLERARTNRLRAEKCRELMRVISNQDSIAMLDEFARELEATAAKLEADAKSALPETARAASAS